MQPVSDLKTLLSRMDPVLNTGRYVFVSVPPDLALEADQIVASIREPEGFSAVLAEHTARDLGLPASLVMAWITLGVHSDLAATGLTAAFSRALAQAGISCNVVAGIRHDHLFVPVAQAQQAMQVLRGLSRSVD